MLKLLATSAHTDTANVSVPAMHESHIPYAMDDTAKQQLTTATLFHSVHQRCLMTEQVLHEIKNSSTIAECSYHDPPRPCFQPKEDAKGLGKQEHYDHVGKAMAEGAVPGFATKRFMHDEEVRYHKKLRTTSHAFATDIEARVTLTHGDEFYMVFPEGHILTVKCPPNTTADMIMQAHESLHNGSYALQTAVGTGISPKDKIKPGHFLLLVEHSKTGERIEESGEIIPPTLQNATREHLLWQQKGWVAIDEMAYYLQMVEIAFPGTTQPALLLPDTLDAPLMLTARILQTITSIHEELNGTDRVFPVLHRNHWFPIYIKGAQHDTEVWTSCSCHAFVQQSLQQTIGFEWPFQIKSAELPVAFENDCGFQTVGWLISTILEEDTRTIMTARQACHWRAIFHQHLVHTDMATHHCHRPIQLGGANDRSDLQTLLVAHGVSQNRSRECAEQLIASLGQQAIQSILQSPRPWADLKARASLQSPPIRIVLAEELRVMLQNRNEAKALGSKKQKQKNLPRAPRPNIQVLANQLHVPYAVFTQSDGVELEQISPQQLGPKSQGIVVLNATDAAPYFDLTAPVSTEGVGLLVLDVDDIRLPPNHEIVKVPAQCQTTMEPIILSAALFQLGAKTVCRNLPKQCLAIQEVEQAVVRILAFRDQYPGNWDEFVKRPVKTILECQHFSHLDSTGILDVWDRQFMTDRMSKAKPGEAAFFSVNIRMTAPLAKLTIAASGTDGMYCEPRDSTGRQPDPQYQVIWLLKKTYAEAALAQKTSNTPTTLVRSANRYGLRTHHTQAEAVHTAYRPDLTFLPASDLQKYKVGPMPYGTTKASIMNICKQWGWQARPTGPLGQTPDRAGTFWGIQAAEPPSHWIYQLAHGDVLISPENNESEKKQQANPVLASTKTLQSLRQPAMQSPAMQSSQDDPWTKETADPWKQYKPSTRELSVGQIASIENNMERRLLNKLKAEDADMQSDERVAALEQQLEHLANTVQQNQQMQAQHNQAVATQIQQIDQKVDSQVTSITNMIDGKLNEQMNRIEMLFAKRARVD